MNKKNRDYGEGSVYLANDGRWRGAYKPTPDARTKYFSGKTEAEVKKKLKAFKRETFKYDYIEVQKRTLESLINDWLYDAKIHELKPKSIDIMEGIANNQVLPILGCMQIGNITSTDVQKMVNELVGQKLSYSTIRKAFGTVNECYKWALTQPPPLVGRNPCEGVVLPKKLRITTKKDSVKLFEESETQKIWETAQRYRHGQAVILLLFTGLRIGELLALRWDNVDFKEKTINITENVALIKNREQDAKTKYVLTV